jgi:AraC family transcriptional regulator
VSNASPQVGAGANDEPAGRTGRATLGDAPTSRRVGPFVVSLVTHRPGTVLAPHSHEAATLTTVLGGEYAERFVGSTRGEPVACAPLRAAAKPPGAVHANRVGRRGAFSLLLEIGEADVPALGESASVFDAPRLLDPGPDAAAAARLAAELGRARRAREDEATPLALEGLALEWLGLVARARLAELRHPPRWLARVRERVHETPVESLRLADLATEAGRHASLVARLFRHHYGSSVGEYARQLRVARAAGALANLPRATISQVAQAAGYFDHSHLAHDFRARLRVTPSDWRRVVALRAECRTVQARGGSAR